MKLAVLYICLGRYSVFWEHFFNSCEKNLCQDTEKHYFVFTDKSNLTVQCDRVHLVKQKKMGWPKDTLMRFSMFLRIEDELKKFDYIYFFNANLVVVDKINEIEFFPKRKGDLVVALHPSYLKKPASEFPYDRNIQSLACISKGKGKIYVQGALNGGASKTFLNFVQSIDAATNKDYLNGVIALWHDESHLNKYIIGYPVKVLDAGYVYPEFSFLPYKMRILSVDKNRYGGHKWLRSEKIDLLLCFSFVESILKYYLKYLLYSIRCFLDNS